MIEGINILLPFYDNEVKNYCEWDLFYMEKTDRTLADKNVEELISLGWEQSYIGLKDFDVTKYKGDELWYFFDE